jgi:hypothetical protein
MSDCLGGCTNDNVQEEVYPAAVEITMSYICQTVTSSAVGSMCDTSALRFGRCQRIISSGKFLQLSPDVLELQSHLRGALFFALVITFVLSQAFGARRPSLADADP